MVTTLLDRPAPADVAPPTWSSHLGRTEPVFTSDRARECAQLLDFYGVGWEYEPITFVLETDPDGRIERTARPDFYLPELNLFLSLASGDELEDAAREDALRRLRQRYPDVNARSFSRRDVEGLGQKLQMRGTGASPTSVERLLAG